MGQVKSANKATSVTEPVTGVDAGVVDAVTGVEVENISYIN